MKLWIVMTRWRGGEWRPVHVATSLEGAHIWMEREYAGTVWERRVVRARLDYR